MAADGFITDLKRKFQQGDIVLRLVYVNVAVFLVVTLVQIFLTLFNVPASPWMNYLELPAWTETFIRRPWTLITYMFMHAGVLHILFNMLWLFWFGRLFLAFSRRSTCADFIFWEVFAVACFICWHIMCFLIFRMSCILPICWVLRLLCWPLWWR